VQRNKGPREVNGRASGCKERIDLEGEFLHEKSAADFREGGLEFTTSRVIIDLTGECFGLLV
jgi:hypothetical protein